MVRDEVSQALRKKGQISITAIMMAGFDILRGEGFARTKFKVSRIGSLMDDKLEFRFAGLRGPPRGRPRHC